MVKDFPSRRQPLSDRRKLRRLAKPVTYATLIIGLFLEANFDLVNRLSARLLVDLEKKHSSVRDCPRPGSIPDPVQPSVPKQDG